MITNLLTWNEVLGTASRLPQSKRSVSSPMSLIEAVTLFACGIGAATCVSFLEFKLRIPGHSILRATIPMALGLALVPRRGGGTVMGAGAVFATTVFTLTGMGDRGLGAMTSLFLLGPCLDIAMRIRRPGAWVYLAFMIAGTLANISALCAQTMAKLVGWKVAGTGKSLAEWLPRAAMTYPLCGLVAGLIGAIIWFRWRPRAQQPSTEVQQ